MCGVASLGWLGRPLGSASLFVRVSVLLKLVSLVLQVPPGVVDSFGRLVDSV